MYNGYFVGYNPQTGLYGPQAYYDPRLPAYQQNMAQNNAGPVGQDPNAASAQGQMRPQQYTPQGPSAQHGQSAGQPGHPTIGDGAFIWHSAGTIMSQTLPGSAPVVYPLTVQYNGQANRMWRAYKDDEELPSPDDFPSPYDFALYWHTIPVHRRKIFTADDRYDRFIVNLPGFEPEQIEPDDLDPVRVELVRGMYFEELLELVVNEYMESQKEIARAATAAAAPKAPAAPAAGAKAGPSSGPAPGLPQPTGPVRFN